MATAPHAPPRRPGPALVELAVDVDFVELGYSSQDRPPERARDSVRRAQRHRVRQYHVDLGKDFSVVVPNDAVRDAADARVPQRAR